MKEQRGLILRIWRERFVHGKCLMNCQADIFVNIFSSFFFFKFISLFKDFYSFVVFKLNALKR